MCVCVSVNLPSPPKGVSLIVCLVVVHSSSSVRIFASRDGLTMYTAVSVKQRSGVCVSICLSVCPVHELTPQLRGIDCALF